MNPFLAKPLKRVQAPAAPNLKNSSQEHRPSKVLIPKNTKPGNLDKKTADPQKLKNPSPGREKNTKSNNISVINKFSKEEERITTDPGIPNNIENKAKIFTPSNLKIDKNIKMTFPKTTNKLIFDTEDDIFEYLRIRLKDGKIKNIIQKLDLKKSDFTGFTLAKKNQGFTIYEIEFEEDLDKINEAIKKQKIEINKKPIEIRYVGGGGVAPSKKNIEVKDKDKNIDNKKPENLIHAMKNKTLERVEREGMIKNEKVNNEIKNLQNKIFKHKEELKNAENENDYIRKEQEKKAMAAAAALRASTRHSNSSVDSRRIAGGKIPNGQKEDESVPLNMTNNISNIKDDDKKKMSIEENQKRISKAYVRFKKAFSSQNKDDDDKNKGKINNSEKIQSLAEILKEHIIKPLAEIQEENDTAKPRAGSVGSRPLKNEGIENVLQNIPVQKKNVKKPKIVAFAE